LNSVKFATSVSIYLPSTGTVRHGITADTPATGDSEVGSIEQECGMGDNTRIPL